VQNINRRQSPSGRTMIHNEWGALLESWWSA
jgi:hypothetical protein